VPRVWYGRIIGATECSVKLRHYRLPVKTGARTADYLSRATVLAGSGSAVVGVESSA